MPNFNGLWTSRQQMQARGRSRWPTPPGAPTIGTATAGESSNATVTFTAPADTGYPATISSYTVTSSPGGITATGASSPITVTGLTAGTSYTFTVTATNATGTGLPSAASNSITAVSVVYVEDVFSTTLYTGTSAAQTITNGIDLSTNGGMVFTKCKSTAGATFIPNMVSNTGTGLGSFLDTSSTSSLGSLTASTFNSNGYTLNTTNSRWNASANDYVSWTFRKQAKFFDVVTYTGNGGTQTINHNLGSVPGCIMIKATNQVSGWATYHVSVGNNSAVFLNLSNPSSDFVGSEWWNTTTPTSTTFSVGNNAAVNQSGGVTYVAYLFANNAGGFGASGSENAITCGSFTTDASGNATAVTNLGYQPQWLLMKAATGAAEDWILIDNARGFFSTTAPFVLFPNTSAAQAQQGYATLSSTSATYATTSSTGAGFIGQGSASRTYIFIAIRSGLMRTPTSGATVLDINTSTTANDLRSTMTQADLGIFKDRAVVAGWWWADRVRNFTTGYYVPTMYSDATTAEATPATGDTVTSYGPTSTSVTNGRVYLGGAGSATDQPLGYVFKRARGFLDILGYTGNATAGRTVAHNLGVVPEMIIIKARNTAIGWQVYHSALGNTGGLYLNTTTNPSPVIWWNNTTPTSSVFTLGSSTGNNSTATFVAYLFATVAGVSKVGSYTGTGALQTVNCSFTTGARFVLIKRTDSTGDWYVYDSVRGLSSGNDPYLLINSTAVEATGTNYVDTDTTGFKVTAAAPAGLNASGGNYIFLAIA